MTDFKFIYGPASLGQWDNISGPEATIYALNDANDAYGQVFVLPKSGTVNAVGFSHYSSTGSPPDYQASLQTVTTSRFPSGANYGGCLPQTFSPGVPGAPTYTWVTLGTPATAIAGDVIAAIIGPTGVAPDASNCINVTNAANGYENLTTELTFATSWSRDNLFGSVAIRYDDDFVVGVPAISMQTGPFIGINSTPDEVGGKFTVPFDCVMIGVQVAQTIAAVGIIAIVTLYDALDNILWTHTSLESEPGWSSYSINLAALNLTKDAIYRLTQRPGDTTGMRTGGIELSSSDYRYTLPNGENWVWTERTNGGAWTDSPTKVPYMALIISEVT